MPVVGSLPTLGVAHWAANVEAGWYTPAVYVVCVAVSLLLPPQPANPRTAATASKRRVTLMVPS